MKNKTSLFRDFTLDKNQTLKAGNRFSARFEGDRTIIDLGAFADRFKLAHAYTNTRNLEFRSDRALIIQSFQDYRLILDKLVFPKFLVVKKPRPKFPPDESYRNYKYNFLYPNGDVLVLVDSAIYDNVAASINQYVLDLGRDCYWATIHVVYGGTPIQVGNYIKSRNPVGAVLVGAIVAPWFEMDDDFHGHAEFPCDLYYMDTTGTWSDPDSDGKFNSHTGDVDAEIWIGRIYTPTASGRDTALINDYFARNHKFRLGLLGYSRSALAYVDDDWAGYDDCALDAAYPSTSITKYNAPLTTDADLYKSEVNTLRSFVQLCAHSSVHSHQFTVGTNLEYIHSDYFRDTNPPNAHFYNLFCCGPGHYTSNDYLAGWYLFDKAGGGKNNGLAVIASAKSGSMLLFENFYEPIGDGNVIGDAFVQWWQALGASHDLWHRRWFYGLTLLGDPTLSWWKGAVPVLVQPQQEDVFDHWPRKIQFRWVPVNLPGAKYTLEVDAFGAVSGGKWAEEVNSSFAIYPNISGDTFEHSFVGMQRGRWRVRAVIDGTACSWSPWSYFKFTI